MSTPIADMGLWQRMYERVQAQSWPKSTLYVVATPIGNLGDFSLRAHQALSGSDVIAAEDTRSTRPLLEAWGINTPLMAAHRHNEAQAAAQIVERLAAGERVALVSDAGAPAVSDPGGRIVRAVRQAGYQVVPIPGASAVITALMASGVTTDENPAFVFAGFAPTKTQARQKWLQSWATLEAPVVFFESPHRISATVKQLAELFANRKLSVARELSKRFEEIYTGTTPEVAQWLDSAAHHRQGEFVLILHAAVQTAPTTQLDNQTQQWLAALLEQVSARDAVKIAVKATGLGRSLIYDWVVAQKKPSAQPK